MAGAENKVIQEARERLKLANEAEGKNRQAAIEDLKFASGQQWPADVEMQRKLERRPCLTINKTDNFVRSVVNNMRLQRPRIKVHPVADGADVKVADVIQGLMRHIEVNSNAESAYDIAADSQVRMGWGYWRVCTEYTADDSFDQEIYIEAIKNPFSVYWDPSSVQPDGSDAQWCIITERVKREKFKRMYPGKDPVDFKTLGAGDEKALWATRDEVVIAEYYRIEETPDTLCQLSNGSRLYKSRLPKPEVMQYAGVTVVAERETMRKQLKWSKLTARDELDSRDLPGKYIPVVPVFGGELCVDGEVIRYGMVRQLKDPQRMYNFWRPLSLDTPIPTPDGWKRMGDVHAGDLVFDEQGKPCNVIGESPIHINRKCYRVTFDDGSSVVSDGEHPWTVETRGKRTAKTWEWVKKDLATRELVPGTHFIDVAKPLQLPDADLPIDPYLLGVWLGDGATAEPRITQSTEDVEELRAKLAARGLNPGPATAYGSRWAKRGAAAFSVYGVRKQFTKLGLLGNKHIPAIYLRASESQRWALLQGLMDTDGSISNKGLCSFTNTNPAIADGFAELLRSLGIKVKFVKRVGRVRMWADGTQSAHVDAWQFHFSAHDDQPVFGLSRKASRLPSAAIRMERRTKRHSIVSVEPVDSVPVKCIAVDTPTHLFLAGPGMVPTHNTAETEIVALAPKAPWLMAEGQDEGYEEEWNTANNRSYSRLKYKPMHDEQGNQLPPPQRLGPQPVPTGAIQAAMAASEDLKAVAGMFDPALGAPGQETSGVMVQARQGQSDLSNYHFYDNLTRSIRHTGKIILDLIPHYYDTQRVVRCIGEDGEPESVTINEKQTDEAGAVQKVLNDVTTGTYDVVMDTGPGFQTKRQEAAAGLLEMLKTELGKQIAQVAPDIIVRQLDIPGIDAVADRLAAANPVAQQEKNLPPDLPDEARAIIMHLTAQNQQMQQQLQKLTQEKQSAMFAEQMRQQGKLASDHLWSQHEIEQERIRQDAENRRLLAKEHAANERTAMQVHANLHDTAQRVAEDRFEAVLDAHTDLQLGKDRAPHNDFSQQPR
jgi:hypothetical protein